MSHSVVTLSRSRNVLVVIEVAVVSRGGDRTGGHFRTTPVLKDPGT